MSEKLTMKDAIGWLSKIKCFKEPITKDGKRILNHVAGKRPDMVYDKETGEYRKTKHERMARVPNWEGCCYTITTGFAFKHPTEDRSLSIREEAILQSFPDDFEFVGSRSSMQRQVANAVPVKLAYLIGCCVKEMIKDGGRQSDLSSM